MPGGGVAPVVITGTTDTSRLEAPITLKAYMICAFAAFGGIFFGYDTGWMGGVLAMPYFINQYTGLPYPDPKSPNYKIDKAAFALPASNQSLLTSILSLGTFLGALMAGDCADFTGRRTTIIVGCGIFTVGCILETASTGLGVMVAGRVICGLGVGFISAIVILYMSVSDKPSTCLATECVLTAARKSPQRKFVEPLCQDTSSVSRLEFCWPTASYTLPKTASTPDPTAFPSPCNFCGPSFLQRVLQFSQNHHGTS